MTSILFFTLITSLQLFAMKNNKSEPIFVKGKGKQYAIKFDKNRVAKLYSDKSKVYSIKSKLSFISNTCKPDMPDPNCYLITKVQADRIAYIWDRNNSSIGKYRKIVNKTKNGLSKKIVMGGRLTSTNLTRVFFNSPSFDVLQKNLGLKRKNKYIARDLLVCNTFSWLPSPKHKRVRINSWTTQYEDTVKDFRLINKNDELSNQNFSIARELVLKKIDKNTYKLNKIKSFDVKRKVFPFLGLGFSTHISYQMIGNEKKNNKRRNCVMSFGLDISDMVPALRSIEREVGNKKIIYSDLKKVFFDPTDPYQFFFENLYDMRSGVK